MLTIEDQIQAAHNALHFLDLNNPHLANTELLDAIAGTPSESPLYGALVGSANWIHLGQPKQAKIALATALDAIEIQLNCA